MEVLVQVLKGLILVILLLIFSHNSFGVYSNYTIFPEDLPELVNDNKGASSFLEEDFIRISNSLKELYASDFEEMGLSLIFNLFWDSSKVNASTSQWGSIAYVNMYGGLARHKYMSHNGFAMVICHEFGHHLGGAPYYSSSSWASAEGQSDYYAALKCFKRYLAEVCEGDECLVDEKVVSRYLDDKCSGSLECATTALAGLDIAKVIGGARIKIKSHDPSVVAETYLSHPAAQCRMDTYLAGAICDKDVASPDLCLRKNHDPEFSVRPLCWFKPDED